MKKVSFLPILLAVFFTAITATTYGQTAYKSTDNQTTWEQLRRALEHPTALPGAPITTTTIPSRSSTIVEPAITVNFTGGKLMRSIGRTITNTSNQPAVWKFANFEYETKDIVNNLKAQLTNPTDTLASRLELIHIIAKFLKYSENWQNNGLAPSVWSDPVGFTRWYDPIGWLYSQTNNQCGGYAMLGAILAVQTGYYSYDDFKQVSFNGSEAVTGHALIEIRLNPDIEYYSMIDWDPGEPGLLFPYANSPTGYASSWAIHNNPSLAVGSYYDGKPWSPEGLSLYPLIFTVDTPHIWPFPVWSLDSAELFKQKGQFTLPGNSSMATGNIRPLILMDVADPLMTIDMQMRGKTYMDSISNGVATYLDSITDLIHILVPVEKQEIKDGLQNGIGFATYNSLTDQGKMIPMAYNRIPVPVVNITIGATDSIKMPLLVMAINEAAQCGDTVGPFDIPLWQDAEELPVNRHYVNYLSTTVSSGTEITCGWNGKAILPTKEWVIEVLEGNLAVTTSVEFAPNEVTSVVDVASEDAVALYPNPTQGKVALSEQLHDVRVTNIAGQLIASFTEAKELSLFIPTGMYLLSGKTETGTPVVLKFFKN